MSLYTADLAQSLNGLIQLSVDLRVSASMSSSARFSATLGITFLLIATLIGGVPGGLLRSNANTQSFVSAASAKAAYGALPLSFIANAGQIDPSVRYQVRSSAGTLSFESDEVMLNLPALAPDLSLTSGIGDQGVRAAVGIRLRFENASPTVALSGADQLPGTANFFIGNDPSQWYTDVPTYASVVYHDLYPGVDLSYAGHPGLLKGTYSLAAGVEPSVIHWRYDGATDANLDASGNLQITAPDGVTLTEQLPVAWQS